MTQEEKQRVITALEAARAVLPCPRCQNAGPNAFSLLDGYFLQPIQATPGPDVILGGASVPCAAVACNRCGFLSFHALGALRLLATAPQGPAKPGAMGQGGAGATGPTRPGGGR